MPIYEFECRGCGNQFEHLLLPWLAKDGETPECPSCHGTKVERMLSICAISSEATRQSALDKARKKNRKVAQEKETEEFKMMVNHANEHH